MRRASTCLAVLGLALMALPGVASALPTVKFKAVAVPIPGFPHTGNILGAGAALKTEYLISGTEYLGSPPPIIGVNFYLPSGSKLHPTGFPTCSAATLEQFGPIKCPKGSAAGPVGMALGYVTFGGERVEETTEVSSFYSPGGGFLFFTDGHTPVSLEILSPGQYKNFVGGGGYGPRARSQGAARRERARRAVRVGQEDRSQGRLGVQVGTARRSTTAACRRNARQRRLPAEDRSDLRGKRGRIETGERDGRRTRRRAPASRGLMAGGFALHEHVSSRGRQWGDLIEVGGVARSL